MDSKINYSGKAIFKLTIAFLNICSYTITTNKRSEMFEMQMEQSLFKSTSTFLNNKLHQLLDNDFSVSKEQIKLLTPQPIKQRLSFLERTINSGIKVLVQLIPINNAGYPVNVRGTVKKIGDERYLIQSHNVSYIVGINQIRYIANI